VRYSEFFWNPTGTARDSGIAYPRGAGRRSGARSATPSAQFGIAGRLVPRSTARPIPRQRSRWSAGCRPARDEVRGIGIDYREVDRPPEMFAAAYAAARRGGLKTRRTPGEFGMPWTNVRTALDVLQVDRIDHGYTTVDEPAFAARCAEAGVCFTVVPDQLVLPAHAAAGALGARSSDPPHARLGLRIHPNTDDPTLHHVTPTAAWTMMVREFGFDLDSCAASCSTASMPPGSTTATRRRCAAKPRAASTTCAGSWSRRGRRPYLSHRTSLAGATDMNHRCRGLSSSSRAACGARPGAQPAWPRPSDHDHRAVQRRRQRRRRARGWWRKSSASG
jgi:hypothetical protein